MTKPFYRQILVSQKGVALLMAITSLLIMTFIAVQVQYTTQVEALSANQAINRLKAYYSAKAGVELSLYRIMMFKKASHQFAKALGENTQLLNKIWQIPLSWPLPIPKELGSASQDQLKKVLKESIFDGKYVTTIESEESKIDLNALASKSKTIASATRAQILNLLLQKHKEDEDFREKYQVSDFEEVLNNITDWIDEDSTRMGGGDERELYFEIKETDKLPPNQPFKTIQELHMVAKMEDAIYDVLAPHVTVYGSSAININEASKEVLRSLDPEMTDEIAEKIIARRRDLSQGGPFSSADDFYGFLDSLGFSTANLRQKNYPLEFNKIYNFRITAVGNAANISRKIVAMVYDVDQVKDYLKGQLEKEQNVGQPPASTPPPNKTNSAQPTTAPTAENKKFQQGRPNVVYWFEN